MDVSRFAFNVCLRCIDQNATVRTVVEGWSVNGKKASRECRIHYLEVGDNVARLGPGSAIIPKKPRLTER